MRKIILNLAVSLDNYIEGPQGETDWMTFSTETGKILQAYLREIDTVLYGRISYEKWGTYQPPVDAGDFEKDFYRALGAMQSYVFSSGKTPVSGNPTVITDSISERMRTLKAQPGKNIWLYGGAELIQTFMELNLVDEFRLAVYPIILGAGKPLFDALSCRVPLELIEVQSHASGVVALTYRPQLQEK